MGALRTVTSSVAGIIVEIVTNDYEEVWRRMDRENAVSAAASSETLTISPNEVSEVTHGRKKCNFERK